MRKNFIFIKYLHFAFTVHIAHTEHVDNLMIEFILSFRFHKQIRLFAMKKPEREWFYSLFIKQMDYVLQPYSIFREAYIDYQR